MNEITNVVSCEWLNEHLNHQDLVILDATIPKVGGILPPETLNQVRIPGARYFHMKGSFTDLENELPNTMPSPSQFTEGVQSLGISNESIVIIYDGHGVYSSPRAWYMFLTMGHENVAVLDGGLPAWIKNGYPIEDKVADQTEKKQFNANFQSHNICDRDEVNSLRNNKEYLILDARSEGRFKGTSPEPRKDLRGGHIPGSGNLPYTKIIRDGLLLPKNEMAQLYDQLNPDRRKLIFSCGSGITACVIALGAAIAGHPVEKIYDGSWSDWGRPSDYPVARG